MSGHLGILGGGQLGRMLALAAHRLGVAVRVLDPDPASPTAAVAPTRCAPWGNRDALDWLADGAAAITWEREDVPLAALEYLATRAAVRPRASVLRRVQDRALQKQLLRGLGLETAPWIEVGPGEEPDGAAETFGFPAVVKARRGGFDGRGQRVVRDRAELRVACAAFRSSGAIVEPLVDFDDEVAVLAVRGTDGAVRTWAPVLTRQVDGQLAVAEAPHPEWARVGHAPREIATRLAHALDHVGVLAVECFRIGDRLLVNELAPRVHNSGHWTPEGSVCGQFEQHVRAVLGLPLGDCRSLGSAALLNCVGQLPDAATVLGVPGATLTVYGKHPRPGRKLGHISLVAPGREELHAALSRLSASGLPSLSSSRAAAARHTVHRAG